MYFLNKNAAVKICKQRQKELFLKLLVIDGNSIVNRAFYGIRMLTARNGMYTNAITGFLNILLKLKTEHKPDEIAIAFDLKAPTFRHKMYTEYKAQRKGMPEELAMQMPVLKQLLEYLGYNIVSCEGYEADDILGTLSKECEKRNDICLLATGDRDSLQLVSKTTSVLLATTKAGKSITIVTDEKAVLENYNLKPKQLIDVKSLMGDTSDNIPGVEGVGEKTALALIQNFNSLNGVYDNINDERIKKGAREKLIKCKEKAFLSYELATINCDVPIDKSVGTYKVSASVQNLQNAVKLLNELEMFAMVKKLDVENIAQSSGKTSSENEVQLQQSEQLNSVVNVISAGEFTGTVCIYIEDGEKNAEKERDENEQTNVICVQSNKLCKTSLNDEQFLNMLENADVEKKCFDAKPLYKAAFAKDKRAQNIVFDAKIAAYLLNPESRNYTVQELAQSYGIKPQFACEFASAAVIEQLCESLKQECEKYEMYSLLCDIEMPLCKVLAHMELVGIQVDKQGIEEFGQELSASLKNELLEIYKLVGYEFNVNSPKQLGKALFEDMMLPTGKKTKSGYSTNAEVLENLRQYSPVINHILLYRTYQKLNSTYVEGLLKVIGEDMRIHSTFNQTETRTGRISSGEPNLQNIPVRTELGSRFRKYFVAKEGCVLLDADYSQIELRILAHVSGDETMQHAFNTNADIHKSTAAKSYGVSEDEVTSQMRSSAKAINFGIVYGIGAFSLSKDLSVSVKKADEFIKTYFENFPGVKQYLDKTVQSAKDNGYVTTLYNRRRNLPELSNSNFNVRALGQRMAMNTPIQGTAADIIKLAMVKVYDRLSKENLNAKLILQVHDELIVETPIDEIQTVKQIIAEEMSNAAKLAVPLLVDVNEGKTWYDAKG